MQNKLLAYIVLGCLLVLALMPTTQSQSSSKNLPWWDDEWSYRQEIEIPFSTDKDLVKYQPVDLKIEFQNDCWTKNEEETSIRVCCYDQTGWHELESQIYNLECSQNDEYIKSCNVVFIIPETANGRESYFVYYDENMKESPVYPDHVDVEELYYHHEPIPGITAESTFYAIKEEGYYIYYVAQEGSLIGQWISQGVVKLDKNTTEIRSDSAGQIAQFSFSYYKGSADEDSISTSQKFVSKNIMTNGNLMIQFSITSESKTEDIRTTNVYKYYFCPTEHKRIRIHVKHEILDDLIVGDEVEFIDGSYASMMSFKSRSGSIKDMNFGEILPYLHVYNGEGQVKEYTVDPNPNYKDSKMFLSTEDSCVLGEKAWISIDDTDGPVNAILLSSNKGLMKNGIDEKDGVQIRGYELEFVNIPGLEADLAQVHMTRNSYENGVYDREIPEGAVIEFDAELFTTDINSYEIVEKEVEIFQLSAEYASSDYDISDGDDGVERYDLKVYAHNANSFPLGSLLSVASGWNLSYISAEIHRDNRLISTGVVSRIKTNMGGDIDFEGKGFFEKIRASIKMLDLRNITLFKTIDFYNLPEGRYVVKIYRENPLRKDEREIIGLAGVNLEEDTKTHVLCTEPGTAQVSVVDQNEQGVENADVRVFIDEFCVEKGLTDENGEITIDLPCQRSDYNLRVFYKGFNIYNDSFKLNTLRRFIPVKIPLSIELYDFDFTIVDLFGLSPGIELKPYLTSDQMDETIVLTVDCVNNGRFTINDLYPAAYKITTSFKSFKVETKINIPDDVGKNIEIVFPAEFDVKVNVFNSVGNSLENAFVTVKRDGIELNGETDYNGKVIFVLPPGHYTVKTQETEKTIMVSSDENVELVTDENPVLFLVITIISLAVVVLMLFLALLKKISWVLFMKALVIGILLISITMSWWQLSGVTNDSAVETNVNTFPWSQKIVSTTTHEGVEYREISTIPTEMFSVFLQGVFVFSIICVVIMFVSMFTEFLHKNRLSRFLVYVDIVLLVILMGMFFVGMNQFCEIGIGSVYGSGDTYVNIPGGADYVYVPSVWGMDLGFYLCVVSFVLLFVLGLYFNRENKYLGRFLKRK